MPVSSLHLKRLLFASCFLCCWTFLMVSDVLSRRRGTGKYVEVASANFESPDENDGLTRYAFLGEADIINCKQKPLDADSDGFSGGEHLPSTAFEHLISTTYVKVHKEPLPMCGTMQGILDWNTSVQQW